MPLSKARRNDLMKALLSGGLKAQDCTFHNNAQFNARGAAVSPLEPLYQIYHKPTGSTFEFNTPSAQNHGYLIPRDTAWMGQMRSCTDPWETWTTQDWQGVVTLAEEWAALTAEWAVIPDLWRLNAKPLPKATDNRPFTQPERDEIAKSLDDITQFVRDKFELPDDQLAAIGQAVEELKEASGRIGRKDWKLMLYGALISLGLEHAVSSGVVEVVYRLAVHGLGHLFGAGSPPMITA
jgi:hypothetical protein